MSISATDRLLEPDEPPPVLDYNRQGASRYVIIVDHASRRIPRKLGDLGLPAEELTRHVAWDIGALAVALRVAEEIDAPLVAQNYSRLVIDCNRPLDSPSSIPQVAEYRDIPGNIGLGAAQVAARQREIFQPYHDHIEGLLEERGNPVLVALHSMTDLFKGSRRAMHAAVMYNRDPSLALPLRNALMRESGLVVADNEPYRVSDATDFAIPVYGEGRGLLHVGIEIRQDLIGAEPGQREWAMRIATALHSC
jgi:predicted N-formylglutamate amidohydrolase